MADLPQLFDDLFRHRYARLVAGLVRVFGAESLELVEDVLQEAMMRALRRWPYEGVPERPEAWLATVARNIAVDATRRADLAGRREGELARWAERASSATTPPDEVADDQLRMIFTCCHPVLSPGSRVALTLKSVCGFGVNEISRALLMTPATAARRVTRAKAALRAENVAFDMPVGADLHGRLTSVLDVIYLVFNEGYAANEGDDLMRHDLMLEALRLCSLVLETPHADEPRTHALAALMLFTGARTPARIDAVGSLTVLAEQDRSSWRRDWLGHAWRHFERSAAGDEETAFHLEAAIASCHAAARDYASTDWETILGCYDRLLALTPSPIVRLNRVVAILKARGSDAALAALDELEADAVLADYHLFPATRAMVLWTAGRPAAAADAFDEACRDARTTAERRLLEGRARHCRAGAPPPAI